MRRSFFSRPKQIESKSFATYRGKDVNGLHKWEVDGQIYTSSVSTIGGGSPAEGKSYPALANQPNSRAQWVALVRPSGKLMRHQPVSGPAVWPFFRRNPSGINRLDASSGIGGVPTETTNWPVITRAGKNGASWQYTGSSSYTSGGIALGSLPPWRVGAKEQDYWLDASLHQDDVVYLSGMTIKNPGNIHYTGFQYDWPAGTTVIGFPHKIGVAGDVEWEVELPLHTWTFTPDGGGGDDGGGVGVD